MALKKGLSSKDTEKICLGFRAGQCFQMKDKKEKPFGDHHSGRAASGASHALLPGFSSLEQTGAPPRCSWNCQAKLIFLQ